MVMQIIKIDLVQAEISDVFNGMVNRSDDWRVDMKNSYF